VRYELDSVTDLAGLWRAVESANSGKPSPGSGSLYPLRRSAAAQDSALSKLPEATRAQIEQYQAMGSLTDSNRTLPTPRQALAKHILLVAGGRLMGAKELYSERE
jgi:hypothetical protein